MIESDIDINNKRQSMPQNIIIEIDNNNNENVIDINNTPKIQCKLM